MRHRFRGLALALAASAALAGPALAEDAPLQPEPAPAGDAAGAARLKAALTGFLTARPFETKTARIEPAANGQRITIDPAAALTQLVGTPVTFAPLSFLVSERTDGTWNVFSADPAAFSGSFPAEGQAERFSYRQEWQRFKGIYSPELASFLSGEGQAGPALTEQIGADGTSSRTRIEKASATIASTPAGEGATDITARQVQTAYRQTTTIPLPQDERSPPASLDLEFGAETLELASAAKAARTRSLLDLYSFVLNHAEDLGRDAKGTLEGPFGSELKTRLRAVLPLWASVEGAASVKGVSASSLYGTFRAADASQSLRLSGLAADSSLEMDLALRDIAVATPALPAWGASLVPDRIEIGFAVTGVDLATPLDLVLEEADFAKDPPLSPEAQARVLAAFSPERIRARLKPSRIHSRDLDIALSGETTFAGGAPAATLTIDAGGLDTAIATLQGAAASQPELHQAVGLLQFAKGLSRPKEGGRMEWVVSASADGSVAINGTMLKGPDAAPGPEVPEDGASPDETPGDAPSRDTL